MRVIIEGTLEQVGDILMPKNVNHRAKKGESQQAMRYKEITEQRKIIRRAFDFVRRKEERQDDKQKLLDALAGRTGYTQSVMILAKKIIAEHC